GPVTVVFQRAELLELVMAGTVGAKKEPVLGDLDRVAPDARQPRSRCRGCRPGRSFRRSSPSLRGPPSEGPRLRWWVELRGRPWLDDPSGRRPRPGAAGRGWRPGPHCG